MRAPKKKMALVEMTERGDAIGTVRGAASRVEKRHGMKR
jgi:hypothetical protein